MVLTMHLYSLRSERNWGIGDFTDLLNLMKYAAEKSWILSVSTLYRLVYQQACLCQPV